MRLVLFQLSYASGGYFLPESSSLTAASIC